MRRTAGMTLLEIMVSLGILAMMSLLTYGAFDSISRGKKAEAFRIERARQGRMAMTRMVRELSAAYLTQHRNTNPALNTSITAFIGQNAPNYDRLDFASFSHQRFEANAKESDQAEIGYFVVKDPDKEDKMDLCRREQFPIDLDPKKGGIVNVLAEDVESFDIKYLDPTNSRWLETWDTTQAAGQLNRLPLELRITLVLKGPPNGHSTTFTTRIFMPIYTPLSFGILQ
jgi:general secretion pathway protein J